MEIENVKERETWSSKLDFLLALSGFSIGLGNVWRFPYLCFKNGGGSFLIPYLICLIVAGFPVTILEIGVGQYTSQGGITAWNICPLVQGIGYASIGVMQYIVIYYNVIIGWSLFYMFASFQSTLPWTHCGNEWNTPNCFEGNHHGNQMNHNFGNVTQLFNVTARNGSKRVSASQEYWDRRVLRISDGLGEPGTVNWDLALCLLLAWILCYLCVCKGVKSSGKVVYFTATAPYIFLTVLLIRGVTLPGAAEGIKFYLTPDWSKLAKGTVWLDAATQVFFSYSIGMGGLMALGSFNKYHNNFYKDCIWYTFFNSGTSIYAGFLIFSVLGFMAKNQGVEVKDVVQQGPGLAFIAYPEAVAQMPIAPLWSFFFFFMLLLLGMDSEFVGIEAVVTASADLFPHYLRRGCRKELFTAFMCAVWYLVGLSMVTKGGMYVFQLFDSFSGSGTVLLLVVVGESVAIGWLYGWRRFYDNIESMVGLRINPWSGWCWCFFSPIFCLFIFFFYTATYSPLKYGKYEYPDWGMAIGWLLTVSSLMFIPGVMIYKLINTTGTIKERFSKLIQPDLVGKKTEDERTKLIEAERNDEYHGKANSLP